MKEYLQQCTFQHLGQFQRMSKVKWIRSSKSQKEMSISDFCSRLQSSIHWLQSKEEDFHLVHHQNKDEEEEDKEESYFSLPAKSSAKAALWACSENSLQLFFFRRVKWADCMALKNLAVQELWHAAWGCAGQLNVGEMLETERHTRAASDDVTGARNEIQR